MSEQPGAYLNLFLFSVGGVNFAVDAEQAEGMVPYAGEEDPDLFWAHEELGFGTTPVSYRTPTIITIRTAGAQPYRVIIDAMEDIAEFSRNDIRLFPGLLEPAALRNGMWGILLREGSLVLLVDFQRLIQKKRSHFSDTRQGR
ncbi:MAG: hypothetical protein A2076_13345 [Geobacteraceae bacterium GWC2_53_11]|nr:MAG: hypothetical protein A2076_13345 [Geobacteraceae bacterium GWC2_53_11]